MAQQLYENAIGSAHSGYILTREEVVQYLEEKYPIATYGVINFDVYCANDRFYFIGPEQLSRVRIQPCRICDVSRVTNQMGRTNDSKDKSVSIRLDN